MATKKKVAKKKVTKKKATKRKEPEKKYVDKKKIAPKKSSKSERSRSQFPSIDSHRKETEIKTNVEQPTEGVMSNGYGSQTWEDKQKKFQDTLKKLVNDKEYQEAVVKHPELLWGAVSEPSHVITLIAVGQAAGKYEYTQGEGYCCCC